MTGTYNGTIEEFEEEFMVCTGLANFALLWDHKKSGRHLITNNTTQGALQHCTSAHVCL